MSRLLLKPACALAIVLGLASAAPASASLIGVTAGCSITPTPFWVCSSPTAVVGAGVEFELELPESPSSFGLSVDIGATSVRLANIEDNGFGLGAGELLTLSGLNAGAPIIGITNFTVSGVSVISAASVLHTADTLTINIDSGAYWDLGSFVSFDIVTGGSVPLPGTLGLAGLGLLGAAAAARRRVA